MELKDINIKKLDSNTKDLLLNLLLNYARMNKDNKSKIEEVLKLYDSKKWYQKIIQENKEDNINFVLENKFKIAIEYKDKIKDILIPKTKKDIVLYSVILVLLSFLFYSTLSKSNDKEIPKKENVVEGVDPKTSQESDLKEYNRLKYLPFNNYNKIYALSSLSKEQKEKIISQYKDTDEALAKAKELDKAKGKAKEEISNLKYLSYPKKKELLKELEKESTSEGIEKISEEAKILNDNQNLETAKSEIDSYTNISDKKKIELLEKLKQEGLNISEFKEFVKALDEALGKIDKYEHLTNEQKAEYKKKLEEEQDKEKLEGIKAEAELLNKNIETVKNLANLSEKDKKRFIVEISKATDLEKNIEDIVKKAEELDEAKKTAKEYIDQKKNISLQDIEKLKRKVDDSETVEGVSNVTEEADKKNLANSTKPAEKKGGIQQKSAIEKSFDNIVNLIEAIKQMITSLGDSKEDKQKKEELEKTLQSLEAKKSIIETEKNDGKTELSDGSKKELQEAIIKAQETIAKINNEIKEEKNQKKAEEEKDKNQDLNTQKEQASQTVKRSDLTKDQKAEAENELKKAKTTQEIEAILKRFKLTTSKDQGIEVKL